MYVNVFSVFNPSIQRLEGHETCAQRLIFEKRVCKVDTGCFCGYVSLSRLPVRNHDWKTKNTVTIVILQINHDFIHET